MNMKKLPIDSRKNGISANGMMKSRQLIGLGDGGSRDTTVRLATIMSARMKNAQIRIVHYVLSATEDQYQENQT